MTAIDVSAYLFPKPVKFNVRCPCGNQYKAVFEFRRSIRRKTDLAGIYTISDSNGQKKTGSMRVTNISVQGLQLKTSQFRYAVTSHDLHSDMRARERRSAFSTLEPNRLAQGDRIRIEFFLDDPKKSFISRDGIVKWIGKEHVGLAFFPLREFDPSLRFYLLGLSVE